MDKKERIEQIKAEREQRLKEYWKGLLKFESEDDIPDIPVVSKDEYDSFYVPILLRCGAIPKDKLIVGKTYIGNCRNAGKAIWKGEYFEYERCKFGTYYTERINHFQDDNGYDLFVPIKEYLYESDSVN